MDICGCDEYYRDMWHFGKIKGAFFSSDNTGDTVKLERASVALITGTEKTAIDAQKVK